MKTTVAFCTLMLLSLFGSSFSAAIAADAGKARNVRQYAPGVPTTVDNFGNLQGPGVVVPLDAYGNPVGSHVDAYGNPVAIAPQQPQQVIVQQQAPKSPYGGGGGGSPFGALGGLFATFFG